MMEYILLSVCWLASGVFVEAIEPLMQNKVVLAGATNAAFSCASTSNATRYIMWSVYQVGAKEAIAIKLGEEPTEPEFDVLVDRNEKVSRAKPKIANVSTAGAYKCQSDIDNEIAQLIVITEEPVCRVSSELSAKSQCDKISQLSCSMKYAANSSYVMANMAWSTGDNSGSLKGTMKMSADGNITIATSTLDITEPKSYTSVSAYKCNATFSLTDKLTKEFVKNALNYSKICSPSADVCTRTEPVTTSSKKPPMPPTRHSTKKPDKNLVTADKSVDNETGPPGNSGGWSAGSPQRSVFIICVVGISCLLLIGTGRYESEQSSA